MRTAGTSIVQGKSFQQGILDRIIVSCCCGEIVPLLSKCCVDEVTDRVSEEGTSEDEDEDDCKRFQNGDQD